MALGRLRTRVSLRGARIPTTVGPRAGLTRQAGVGVQVTVYGAREAIAKLIKVGTTAYADLGYIVYRGAVETAERARELVPVDTGALQSGIKEEKVGVYDWRVIASSAEGGADREYAAYVEYGTYKMAAQPYLRPAMSEQRGKMLNKLTALALKLERI